MFVVVWAWSCWCGNCGVEGAVCRDIGCVNVELQSNGYCLVFCRRHAEPDLWACYLYSGRNFEEGEELCIEAETARWFMYPTKKVFKAAVAARTRWNRLGVG